MSKVGTVQEFKTKPLKVEAIQFTGKNGRAVVEFLRANDIPARNGGQYVTVNFAEQKLTMRKGHIAAVVQSTGYFGIYDEENFRRNHSIPKTAQFI